MLIDVAATWPGGMNGHFRGRRVLRSHGFALSCRSVRSSASCSDAYKAAVAVGGRAIVVNPIDNADSTPVRPATDGRSPPADMRTNENLT
jgi:hypothetical protein